MIEGWIKSYRQLLGWQHFQEPIVLQVWIAILHSANSKDSWLRGRRIRRGEWVTSTAQIMAICGIGSNNTVIEALNTLEESGEIKRERFGNATKITVCHFSKFQGYAENAQPTAQPTAHKQEYIERKESKKERKEELISPPLPPEGDTARKKEKKPKEPPHAVTRYDKAFEEIYQQHTGQPFAWSRRENVAVNAIVGKISTIMVAQGQIPTDDAKLDAFKWFIRKIITVGDEWMKANLTPHIIDSKFNEYYQRIKSQENGTARNNSTNNPYGVSPEYLAKIAKELGGVL